MKKLISLIAFTLWASIAFAQAGSENKMNALSYTSTGVFFADLSTVPPQVNGTHVYCKDCQIATVCVGSGGGAAAELIAGVWNCGNNAVTGSVPDPLSLNTLQSTGSSPLVTGFSLIPGALVSSWLPNARGGADHLFISPDNSTPTTTMDVTADVLTMVNPGTGKALATTAFSANDLVVGSQTGATLNARDQTAAFASSTFYHLYAIGAIGQTPGVIASLTGPPTGPTLPTNYTAWAYLGTFQTDGSGNVLAMYGRGNQDYYKVNNNILVSGSATSSTNVPISTLVPSIASRYQIYFNAVGSATGIGAFFVDVGLDSGTLTTTTAFYAVRLMSQVTTVITGYSGWIDMPYITGGFYYRWQDPNTLTIADNGFSVQVQSYTVPNNSH